MITVRKVTSPVSDVGILLGRQGENEARRIVFDLSWLIDTYGDGTAQLVHKRSKDGAPYAISTTQEENTLTWIVTNTDTAYDGGGKAELRWTVNNTLAKTITYQTIIIHSITADTVLPDPYQSWYDALIEYINERSISPEDLADAVAEYISEHPIEAPVMSVNSKTGDVVLSASDVGAGTYSKPANGIPKTDLASSVQTSLGKADTALQSFTETDPTVPSWAKASSKPSYTAQEVGALPADTTIPTKTSQLQNDSGFGTYSKPSGGIPKTDLASAVQTSLGKADSALQTAPVTSVNNKTGAVTLSASDVGAGTYSKPSGGIPSSDMTSSVQTSLGKADSAYQKPSGGIPSTDMSSAVQTSLGKADSALQTAPVTSVNTKTGAVTLGAGDIGYDDSATYNTGTVGNAITDLKGGITEITTGTSEDIGKALSPKTVSSGKVTEWQYVATGGGGSSPSPYTSNPAALGTASPGSSDAYARGDHVHPKPTAADLGITVPSASSATPQALGTAAAGSSSDYSRADHVHGMPTAANVGAEPATVVTNVSGTTPSITANENTRYICGEILSLSFTPCNSGICDVRFTSGSTATVLTVPNTVKFPDWFDATSLDTNTVYEINIMDGVYGAVMSWGA